VGLYKQLLLGSAAVLTAGATAQAADLPSRKAAPVEYVKICDAYGAGFFFIPGTDTCIRLGGYVRVEASYAPGHSILTASNGAVTQIGSAQDQTGLEVRGRIDVDARTQTNWAQSKPSFAFAPPTLTASQTYPPRLTFRRATPSKQFLLGPDDGARLHPLRRYHRWCLRRKRHDDAVLYVFEQCLRGFPNGIKQLAYTAIFGGGFSATAAIESQGDFGYTKAQRRHSPGPSAVSTAEGGPYVNQFDTGYELVGNVRYDASWGYVQLAGLVGNDSVGCAASTGSPTGQTCSSTYNSLLGPTKYGEYGFMGSFGVKLPMIAPGDEFHFQVGYATASSVRSRYGG